MARPLIAVSAAIENRKTAFGEVDCTTVTAAYTRAISAAGGLPVVMPVIADLPEGLLDRMDGLVLTGGGDIDPALYGQEPDPSVYGIRKDRDAFELALYREAVALGLPILAICRGMQLVNIARGGTLLQQVTDNEAHWQQVPAATPNHEITVTPGSALAEATGQTVLKVNSYHHQGLADLGTGLYVTAVCGDVIEAVEAVDADIVAVQWHPEQMAATDPQQQALFDSLVQRSLVTRPVAQRAASTPEKPRR